MCQTPAWPAIQPTRCGDCQSAEMDSAHVEHGAGCSNPFPHDHASSSSTPPCRPRSCVLSPGAQGVSATDLSQSTIPFNVFVKSDEALITMESTPDESIASLLGRAAARLEQAVSYLDLGGRRLREEFTLGEYNIQNDTTLYCQSRLLGGARGKGKGKAIAADMLDDFSMDIDSEASEDEDYQEEDLARNIKDDPDDPDVQALCEEAASNGRKPDQAQLEKLARRKPRPHPGEPILMAPIHQLRKRIQDHSERCYYTFERKLPATDQVIEDPKEFKAQLTSSMLAPCTQSSNENEIVSVRCSYSGRLLHLEVNSPLSSSADAVYQAAVLPDDRLGYHTPANVILTTGSLNFTKHYMSVMVLPIMAETMRVSRTDLSWPEKRDRLQWLVNAQDNVLRLHQFYGCHIEHQRRHRSWNRKNHPKRKQMLEALRSGKVTDNGLKATPIEEVFKACHPRSTLSGRCWVTRQNDIGIPFLEEQLHKIRVRYGLSKNEFWKCCCIQNGKDYVFFPFSPLSKNTADRVGWSWDKLRDWMNTRLHYYMKRCNRWAKSLDDLEEGLSAAKMLFDIAHQLCQRIKEEKERFVSADKDLTDDEVLEELAHSATVDEAGIPLVPWVGHAFALSIGKTGNHQRAMRTGFEDGDVTEDFDVLDWKQDRRTIIVESYLTNKAKSDYHPSTLPDIFGPIEEIPWQHALWDIDDSLGKEVWGCPPPSGPLISPSREYDFSILVPIKPWVQPKAQLDLRCRHPKCQVAFKSVADLMVHYQDRHSSLRTLCCDEEGCSRRFLTEECRQNHQQEHLQTRLDWWKAFWDTYLKCPHGCNQGKPFLSPSDFSRHQNVFHFAGGSAACYVKGCDQVFQSVKPLNTHMITCHNLVYAVWQCHQCEDILSRKGLLHRHQGLLHPHRCLVGQCERRFRTKLALNAHLLSFHPATPDAAGVYSQDENVQPVRCPVCKDVCSVQGLRDHISTHKPEKLHCPVQSCKSRRSRAENIRVHLSDSHKDRWCPKCWILFNSEEELASHNDRWHTSAEPGHLDLRDHVFGTPGCWGKGDKENLWIAQRGDQECCLICNSVFAKRKSKSRKKVYLSQKHPRCELQGCQFRCRDKESLNLHLNEHLKCEGCGRRFLDNAVMATHDCDRIEPFLPEADALSSHLEEQLKTVKGVGSLTPVTYVLTDPIQGSAPGPSSSGAASVSLPTWQANSRQRLSLSNTKAVDTHRGPDSPEIRKTPQGRQPR